MNSAVLYKSCLHVELSSQLHSTHAQRNLLRIEKLEVLMINRKNTSDGRWLWHSWQSGHIRHQRSAVQIPTLVKIYLSIIWHKKTKLKKKGQDWPIKKNTREINRRAWLGTAQRKRSRFLTCGPGFESLSMQSNPKRCCVVDVESRWKFHESYCFPCFFLLLELKMQVWLCKGQAFVQWRLWSDEDFVHSIMES